MKIKSLSVAVSALVVSSLSTLSAATLYTETFNIGPAPSTTGGTGGGTVSSFNTAYATTSGNELTNGWAGFSGTTATDISNSVNLSGIADRQSPNGPTSGANQYGFLLGSSGNPGPLLLATTPTGLTINTATPSLEFGWLQGDAFATDQARFVIQVGGSWYASTTTFTTAAQSATQFGASPSTTAETKNLVFSTASWLSLSFTPGSTLVLGGPTTAPTGNITGLGFYITGGSSNNLSGNTRYDTLTVTGVPEPTTGVLLLGGMFAGAFVMRSRRGRVTVAN